MTARLQRSVLAVPATSPHFFSRAAEGGADTIFLDLEDAVAPDRKTEARGLAITAINSIDWHGKGLAIRINEIGSAWGYRDIIDVVENCPRLDSVLIPKVADAGDVRFVERLLDGIETSLGREKRVGIEALIETPIGLSNVDAIAAASQRLESLSFGVGDYSVAMQVPQTDYGTPDPTYGVLGSGTGDERQYHWNDQWHYALARIGNACRANGLRPIDGPFTNFSDTEGYRACARRARALGFEGKWAIHPDQIEHANHIFSPSNAEIAWARRIEGAMAQALAEGSGAVQLDGKMIDLAHIKQARSLLQKMQSIERRYADN
jgi:malyl-CoA/(S)-citramalyl-CoA lyase